jgi:hypothetical protein
MGDQMLKRRLANETSRRDIASRPLTCGYAVTVVAGSKGWELRSHRNPKGGDR